MKLQTVEGKLYPEDPFDFKQSLNFIDNFFSSSNDYLILENQLKTAVQLESTVGFKVESTGTVDDPVLHYKLFSEQLNKNTVDKVIDRITFFLSLNDDLKPFYQIAKTDDVFKEILDDLYGLHQVKFLTPFEAAAWAILSQRISMNVSRKMKEKLTEYVGNNIEFEGHNFQAFPSPEQLKNMDLDELISIIKNKRKSEYLLNAAEAFSSVDEKFLRTGPLEDVKNWLTDIKGIGEWSAHLELIRGLGRMEDYTQDRMLQGCVEKHYGSTTSEKLDEIIRNYREFPGYWEYYLRSGC
ncbi:MAG: DNA-3-methyladenine glycosylase 2 family protein [Methanobacterium sp.]|nr:DNA-3-methyladenine glycosylase 2 family protein [Methanobacterium sp.]